MRDSILSEEGHYLTLVVATMLTLLKSKKTENQPQLSLHVTEPRQKDNVQIFQESQGVFQHVQRKDFK